MSDHRTLAKVLPTDTAFVAVVDEGPDCVCSRCHKPILTQAMRFWSRQYRLEYRYHFACLGLPAPWVEDRS